MKEMGDKSVDLILTDPPYGIARVWKGGSSGGWGKSRKETSERNFWDNKTPDKIYFDEIFRISKNQIIWGGNYFELPISRGWLIWNKPERNFTLSEAELAWTSRDMVMRVLDCHRSDSNRKHPTQKPEKLMEWSLSFFPETKSVFDPFMGSGTTGVACKKTGVDFTGCELDPTYFTIAKKRIEGTQEMMF